MFFTQATSFGKLILEAYQQKELRSEYRNGIAVPGQKNTLKGLKVLVQATLSDGTVIPKNSIAYLKEEVLYSNPMAKNKLKCDTLPVEFIIVTTDNIEYIEPPRNEAA